MSQPPRHSPLQRLAHWLLGAPAQPNADVERLLRRLDALDYTLTTLANRPAPQPDGQLADLQALLAGIEKQLARNGREQLKANALVEAQQEQTRSALELLDEAATRREETLIELQQRLPDAEAAARLELAQRILPAIDGLDEALRAGEAMLGQPVASRAPSLFERMRARVPPPTPENIRLRSAVRSWLQGLTFVRQRLFDLLAAEDVRPIPALGLPFDP